MTLKASHNKHTIMALVEDKPGVLNRISSMFRRRGVNISSLAVGQSEIENLSRMTFVVNGDDSIVEQVTKHLHKLIDVVKVSDMTEEHIVNRELVLIKVKANVQSRSEIMQIVDIFRANIIDVSPESLIIEVTGNEDKISSLFESGADVFRLNFSHGNHDEHKRRYDIIRSLEKKYHPKDVDVFVGIESRGFILASILAQRYNKGMILLRKAGKLPGKTVKTSYTIEYGKAVLEIQKTALNEGERVVICDDLLATGGTVEAAAKMIEELEGGIVGLGFLIELDFLKAREILSKYKVFSILRYQ